MTSSAFSSRYATRNALTVAVIACALVGAVLTGGSRASGASAVPSGGSTAGATKPGINKTALLDPTQKYYGISVGGAPTSLAGVNTVTKETGKQPNLLMFYEAWNSAAAAGKANLATSAIAKACKQGLLPMLTWESWNTATLGSTASPTNPGVAWAQPAFAPSTIIAGTYDNYITATAKAIKSLGTDCPVALRFDQEQNGYWYPWGLTTQGMSNTAAQYVAMWHHVRKIFNAQGVTNVLWVWSPNFQSATHTGLPSLAATYPGPKYVDWVGIDAYYNTAAMTFANLFGPTIKQLTSVSPHKPWLVAETGVGTSANKPSQITDLLDSVASDARFNGFVYFEQHKATDRAFWPFNDPNAPGSLAAFTAGVTSAQNNYATGEPGSL